MDATTTDINDLEKWVIGSDKKPQFQIFDEPAEGATGEAEAINLALFSGYGVIIFAPDGTQSMYGTGMDGYSTGEVSVVDETTFEVALDKSINTGPGLVSYQVAVALPDADFTDGNNEIKGEKTLLYRSVR